MAIVDFEGSKDFDYNPVRLAITQVVVGIAVTDRTPGEPDMKVVEKNWEWWTHNGIVHQLMEFCWPETEEMEGDEYGEHLDEFEGALQNHIIELYPEAFSK